jgi:hypothetical protein
VRQSLAKAWKQGRFKDKGALDYYACVERFFNFDLDPLLDVDIHNHDLGHKVLLIFSVFSRHLSRALVEKASKKVPVRCRDLLLRASLRRILFSIVLKFISWNVGSSCTLFMHQT